VDTLSPPNIRFAVQTDENGGYDILVREKETSRLPMHILGIGMLTPAHFRFLQKYHGKTAGELTTTLRPTLKEAAQAAGLPDIFAKQFSDALSYLLLEVKDSFFNQAVLDANPQFLPTATSDKDMSRPGTGTVGHIIVFKTLVPSHISVTAPSITFTPLSFFLPGARSPRSPHPPRILGEDCARSRNDEIKIKIEKEGAPLLAGLISIQFTVRPRFNTRPAAPACRRRKIWSLTTRSRRRESW
jgi:hypothetical protein